MSMMESWIPIMASRTLELGDIGKATAANVRLVRGRRGMTQRDLADRMGELGRPLLASGVAKIEAGERRVDVDDLTALAVALNVTPARLLLPDGLADDAVRLTPSSPAPHWAAWDWATGSRSMDGDGQLDYEAERPTWLRQHEQHPLARAAQHLAWAARMTLRSAPLGRPAWVSKSREAVRGVTAQLDEIEVDDGSR